MLHSEATLILLSMNLLFWIPKAAPVLRALPLYTPLPAYDRSATAHVPGHVLTPFVPGLSRFQELGAHGQVRTSSKVAAGLAGAVDPQFDLPHGFAHLLLCLHRIREHVSLALSHED